MLQQAREGERKAPPLLQCPRGSKSSCFKPEKASARLRRKQCCDVKGAANKFHNPAKNLKWRHHCDKGNNILAKLIM